MTSASNDKETANIELQGSFGDSKKASLEFVVRNVKIKEQLDKCEHYFIFWLGDLKLERDDLPEITNELYDIIGRISDHTDDDSTSETEQNVENRKQQSQQTENTNSKSNIKKSEEIKDSDDHKYCHKDEPNDTVKNEDIDKSSENCRDKKTKSDEISENKSESTDSSEDDKSVDVDPRDVQRAVFTLIESFLNIQVGDVNVAKKQILLCSKFVKKFVEEDKSFEAYVPGFDFLKMLLEIHMRLQEENDIHEINLESISSDYDSLPDNSKAVVNGAKWKFLEAVDYRMDGDKSLEALKKAASLDDRNCTWNYVLCMRLRFRRRGLHGTQSKPDEEEINASVASVEMSKKFGRSEHAMARAALCQTISEVLRWRIFKKKSADQPIAVGNLTFESHNEIIKYLKREARNALARFPRICFAEFMRYSEIFSTGLPREHRNYEIAILCMTFCLRILPENSKAHHKMGILYLTGDKEVNEAIPFFRNAVRFGPKNYPAWMDLIQSLLQRTVENNEELEKIFKNIFQMPYWSEKQKTSLKFLQGCYLFMKGEKANAIGTWTSIQTQQNIFHELYRIKARYIWPETALPFWEVRKAVQEMLQTDNSTDKGLTTLYTEITAAIGFENPGGGFNHRSRNFNGTDDDRKVNHGHSEVDEDSQWRRSCKNPSAEASVSNSRNSFNNNNFSGNNYFPRGGSNHDYGNGRYDYRQRHRRSPSPDNWRN